MDNSWVKLYRKLIDNEVLFDDKALRVFIYLLINVDKKTGSLTVGRFRTSEALKLNPNTFYSILKRLEEKYKIITAISNNQFTTISLINWAKYNSYQEKSTGIINNGSTTDQQRINTIQDIKTKDIKTFTNVNKNFGNQDINQASEYFLEVMKLPKEDCTQKQSRQYWYLLLKESKTGLEGIKWLVDQAHEDEFYRNNITSSKDLYYKRIKLVARKRKEPKIAVMPQGGELVAS